MRQLHHFSEPALRFGHDQDLDDPRDGLTLFGPLDEGGPFGIRVGAVGTAEGIQRLKNWMVQIQHPISSDPPSPGRPAFPGFEPAFRIPLSPEPVYEIILDAEDLARRYHLDDKYQRVRQCVEAYASRIVESIKQDEATVDLWFIIVPDDLWRYCRPQSVVPPDVRVQADYHLRRSKALRLAQDGEAGGLLLKEMAEDAEPYRYEPNFHNQLKAELLDRQAAIQIVKESTIAWREITGPSGNPTKDLTKCESAIAWNISTTAFYKAGARPWKIGAIREGVCYVGLVFKQDDTSAYPRSACCAAQMFLDSGDGVVFKGAVGPWHVRRNDYHLSREAARSLAQLTMDSYKRLTGQSPRELFLHGRTWFHNEEWEGFRSAVPSSTALVGVRIRNTYDIKLYKQSRFPVLRGLAYIRDDEGAYLWTRGFVPRLRTCPGLEVPRPLDISIARGETDIRVVLADIMALTKLNYNACIYADGLPVTLKFADAVGEILTSGPVREDNPLPFKYYI